MIKIIPLGGMAVTKNLFVYETDNEILLVDCGIGFPDETMPGVDLLIPDSTYLEKTNKNIVGMLLTHGHDDHVAGLPYLLPRLPKFPIFASQLTARFAQDRMKDFGLQHQISIFDDQRGTRLGEFSIESIKVTHSVPQTRHFLINVQNTTIYHGSDFKFDLTPIDGIRPDFQKIAKIGESGVTILLSDSLRSEREGFSKSESVVRTALETSIRNAESQVIVTLMSSHIHRIQQVIDSAAKEKRKVAFFGRSVEQNVKAAVSLNQLHFPPNTVVNNRKIKKINPKERCLVVAGSQGQSNSGLVRASLNEHRQIKINPKDTIIFSSSAIPGHERAVNKTINAFAKMGADVIYTDINPNLHASGHASAGDLELLMHLLRPKFLVPIGGDYRHMVQYRKLAQSLGFQENKVFILNEGQTINIDHQQNAQIGQTVILKNIAIDGLGIGEIGEEVFQDREQMLKDGILIATVPINMNSTTIQGKIEITSKGFVNTQQSQKLFEKAKQDIHLSLKTSKKPIKWDTLKERIKTNLEKLIHKELERSPLIIPVIIRM